MAVSVALRALIGACGLTALLAATPHAASGPQPAAGTVAPVRAAYFYEYMDLSHLDSLAQRGFGRAVIHSLRDSVAADGAERLRAWAERGARAGVEVVPQWALQSPSVLAARPAGRRYTWGGTRREAEVACPLDSIYWRSALLGRAEAIRAAVPAAGRLAVDLELYAGGLHHYDRGACACPACLLEYTGGAGTTRDPRRLRGLLPYQEARLSRILAALLAEFAARHSGVELGVFDLDYDSFVHRALARALARSGVPAADYCERSYATGGPALPAARARLDALGLPHAALFGGLWLKRWSPDGLPPAVRSVTDRGEGYFVFTTYSLWQEPAKLQGPYLLAAPAADYWRALEKANQAP